MNVSVREVYGPWKSGYVLDRHIINSTFIGNNPVTGRPMFDNEYSEAGQAMYQFKYQSDETQLTSLMNAFMAHLAPLYPTVSFIVTMPPSLARAQQPMPLLAQSIAEQWGKPYFDNLLIKKQHTDSMKNIPSRSEKIQALTSAIGFEDHIKNEGRWDVLILDDLFGSGASLEVATKVLSTYDKVNDIYVAAFTKTGR